MSETVIGSIYPAALIGKTPLFGNIYMPYRLIFTSDKVIAFYPDPKKTFRSGLKVFKAYKYRGGKWAGLIKGMGADDIVSDGSENVSNEMLGVDSTQGYGSMPYDKIGGVMFRAGEFDSTFNILFRPSDATLVRGLEFSTARSALTSIRALLGKTSLSNKIEDEL